jgi:hypothetical protein
LAGFPGIIPEKVPESLRAERQERAVSPISTLKRSISRSILEGRMNKVVSFLSGLITGALLGAAVAILLAPASGQDLRDQMTNRARQIEIEVKQAAAARRAELEQQLDALRTPKQN